jgi:predicted metalloprotease with PDZ domain
VAPGASILYTPAMAARRLAGIISLILGALAATPAPAQSPPLEVQYRFRYSEPSGATALVDLRWPSPLSEPGTLVMPRAIPMGYGEQRYDTFLTEVQAIAADGQTTSPTREEGPRWRLEAGVTGVSYRVNLQQMERAILSASDQSRVRDGYLGALGYSVFAFVDGDEDRPARLRIEGPQGWPVFSTLAPAWPVGSGSIDAGAPDFYALADSQIVMGPRATFRRLTDSPAPLYLAAYSEGAVDLDRVGRLAASAYQRVAGYFGSAPFTHYTIHQELLNPLTPQHEYGMSMEHLNSSTFYLSASTGLTSSSTPEDDARVLYNFAHHMAHAWVPKRAYGHGYFPFQWELAPVLDSIWFAEGFGQYAAIMALAPGAPDPAVFREGMLNRRFRANVSSAPPFLRRLPLVDLSRVASTRYSEDFRTGRLVFSRGGLMAAAIDDVIRQETNGAKSLRDGLRFMVDWTARERRAFSNDELAGLIREATGVDTTAVIEQWLRPLP